MDEMKEFLVAEDQRRNAEMIRQRQESLRQAEELSRATAEAARVAAAKEVSDTVADLTTALERMEAVETMRRTSRGHGWAD